MLKKLINVLILLPFCLFTLCASMKAQASQSIKSKSIKIIKTTKPKLRHKKRIKTTNHTKSKTSYKYKVRGKKYTTLSKAKSVGFVQTGTASWYGPGFHGRKTANGERYNMNALTGAHRTLPLSSFVKVTNLANSKSVVIKINDRGPYYGNRVLDLSKGAAKMLGVLHKGTAKVQLIAL